MTRLAVVIPVGPLAHHADYIEAALASVREQSRPADLIVIVDDMHGRNLWQRCDAVLAPSEPRIPWTHHRAIWNLGVSTAFNTGVAIALNPVNAIDLALMMGADDKLEPRVLERIARTFEAEHGRDGYYWCDTIYEDGTEQALPCNNAAVTRGFMQFTGGLPVEASSGAMDAALISALWTRHSEKLIHVPGGPDGRFWSRQHPNQETWRLNRYYAANMIIRDVFTERFEPPAWGRYWE